MNPSPSKHPNNQLRQERIGHNWRQLDLADRLGTTAVTVRRWERGSQQPSAYFRVKLCALFSKSAEELGLVAVNPSLPTTYDREPAGTMQAGPTATEIFALWTVPYPRNPYFTGRDELLYQLAQHLSAEGQCEPTTTRQVALTQPQAVKGLGGIGKTQVAVEYAYRSREQGHYTHIFWINAATEEAIMTSFVALAGLLPTFSSQRETDQRKLVAAIKHWLEQCQPRWLLIFDNVDTISLVQEYFPHQGNGSILLTTRANAVAAIAASIEVEQMGLMEGTQFLLHRAQRLQAGEEESNEATNIVIALDGFPLALDQAGAYIEETGCSFGDYLQLYQDHRKALLARRGTQATNYPDSVATTWSLSFQKVEQTNPAAAELLRLCAFLAPDHIPEELLKAAAPHWPPVLQQAVVDLFIFNPMIEDLLTFSLVKRLAEDHLLSIHRLVQAVHIDMMEHSQQRQWAERVVSAVNEVFPSDPLDVATWPQCLRYLEQAQACDVLIQRHALVFAAAADLLSRTGRYLYEHASYTIAEPLYQRALAIREQVLGDGHLDTASSLNNLATLYRSQGRYEQAESLYRRALAIHEQILGDGHPNTAATLNNLGVLYWSQGKYEQAEPLFVRALAIREQQFGSQHPDTAASLNNLALLYWSRGKYEQAEPLYVHALTIKEQLLGPESLDVAYGLNNLALVYDAQGKDAQSESLLQRALSIYKQRLGPDHPDTASTLLNLAILYRSQGKCEQAEPLLHQSLAIREQKLGPEHPETAASLNSLAILYIDQSKYKEAEPLFQRALHIREQVLETNHPDLAVTLHGFATLRAIQGNQEEAASLYQHALLIREQVFGTHHPKTSDTRERLRTVLQAMGRNEGAAVLEVAQPDSAKLEDEQARHQEK